MEYISGLLIVIVMMLIIYRVATHKRNHKEEKMEAMIKRTQKVCQARLAENKAETQEGE